jgi:quercetin dioxygenase-like cupin family protein
VSDARAPQLVVAGEGEPIWFLGSLATVKATGAQTSGRLTVVEFVNPPGFAPPLHRHTDEDEIFYVLSGSARFLCGGQELLAGTGDLVVLPSGVAHSFIVGADEPLRALQLTTPAGFEEFARAVGEPALARTLPPPLSAPPGEGDLATLVALAAAHGMEILGPPPVA